MKNITVRFGVGNSIEANVPDNTTFGQIKAGPVAIPGDGTRDFKQALGFGTNVRLMLDRVDQPDHQIVQDGDEIEIETVATTKAA